MPKTQILPPALSLPGDAVAALAQAVAALAAIANALQSSTPGSPLPALTRPVFVDAVTVVEAVNELLQVKAKAGRSDDYLRNLRIHLKKFAQAMDNCALRTIITGHVERWIDGLAVNERTRQGHLDSVSLLFNFSRRRGYVTENPCAAIEKRSDESESEPPTIHTPSEVAKVLQWARTDPDLCRFLAVRYFAGLRATEAQGCVIHQERGFIEVPAKVAKTRRRRLVTIQPNLAEWLKLDGSLPVRQLNNRVASIGQRSGVGWDRNVTRHSFCSYHLAHFQNAAKTALEAGHSEQMLFAHYREIVLPEDAAAFWRIVPGTLQLPLI